MSACSLLDEVGHGRISEVTFEAVPAFDFSAPALEFEFHERTQGAEEMIADGLLAAHKEPLGVADLFDGAMISAVSGLSPTPCFHHGECPSIMKEDALARDLAKMRQRAYHMGEWTEAAIRRYHALVAAGPHPHAPTLRAFYDWRFVPPTLWPLNVLDVLNGCLDVLISG